jgi:molybdopterin converting factor small subunit
VIIEAKVFSTLRHHLPKSEHRLEGDTWEVMEGATVGEVLTMLNLPDEEVRSILINGRKAEKDSVLRDGDVLHVFPMIAGG